MLYVDSASCGDSQFAALLRAVAAQSDQLERIVYRGGSLGADTVHAFLADIGRFPRLTSLCLSDLRQQFPSRGPFATLLVGLTPSSSAGGGTPQQYH